MGPGTAPEPTRSPQPPLKLAPMDADIWKGDNRVPLGRVGIGERGVYRLARAWNTHGPGTWYGVGGIPSLYPEGMPPACPLSLAAAGASRGYP